VAGLCLDSILESTLLVMKKLYVAGKSLQKEERCIVK
jgi:hypothetical protein